MSTGRNREPLVAVVTGVYNGQPYLPAALACVQAQTYPNLVHVVLDNASTDTTPDEIARWAGGRVPILTRRNPCLLAQIDNWNAAFAMVPKSARYIKLLAADDLMRSDCIERLVALAEANPDVSSVTAIDVFDDRVKPHGLDPRKTVFEGREILRRLLQRDLDWIPFHHAFFRMSAHHSPYLFNPAVAPGFDRDLVAELLLFGKMGFVNEILFYTRYHAASVTSALVADGALLCERFVELQYRGAELMTEREVETQLRTELHIILRHVLRQLAAGQSSLATKTLSRLAKLGVRPRVLDYVISALTWPAHLVRKTIRQAGDAAVTPPNFITEAEFLNLSTGLRQLALSDPMTLEQDRGHLATSRPQL